MGMWRCDVCGYLYDGSIGDADNGVSPGTAFENLAEGWICPICYADKSMFHKE